MSYCDDGVRCGGCGESVPREHTVIRAGQGRICWFCHTDEPFDASPDWEDDHIDNYDDDDEFD